MVLKDSSALTYHDATKHSEISLRTSGHYLDWENKPSPFKVYRNLPSIPLPRDFPRPEEPALKAIRGEIPSKTVKPDLAVLAEILFFSAGLTRKMKFGSEEYYMRAASATGALYPIELYVVSGDIPSLKSGVYHFSPKVFALVQLREGDFRSDLALASDESSASSPFTIVMTSLAWRNAWKYEARSYRHWFWDSGVIDANLLATCTSEGLSCKLVLGFVDSMVDKLLGLEEMKEATVCLAVVGAGLGPRAGPARKEIPLLHLNVEPVSKEEVEYPIIWDAHKAGELVNQKEVERWRQGFKPRPEKLIPVGPAVPLRPLEDEPSTLLAWAILRRGSSRRFAQQPISLEQLSTILQASSVPISFDFLPMDETLIDFYFIANDVDGLPSGSYYYDQETESLEQLKIGHFRSMSGYLSLGQPLFSQASVMFFLTTDLKHVTDCFGNRGYRVAQFEAGVRAGKLYLSSYALGLGASGSTFYDDAVTEFFSPHGEHASPMIAVGVGIPGYKAKSGIVLPQFRRV
jgi:SagB-type dehydrogenase family enzyme